MTDWSSVEFASVSPVSRKAQDFLPIMADVLAIWDFLACAAAGQVALALYRHYVVGGSLDASASGPFWREIAFGSLIAAMILRDAGFHHLKGCSISRLIFRAEQKCLLAFAVLAFVGLATRATDDLARMWLLTWLAAFSCTIVASRAACGFYLQRLHGRGDFRESIAIIGASGARDRLAARIAGEARIVGTFSAEAFGNADAFGDGLRQGADDLAELIELGREGGVDSVILALERDQDVDIAHIVQRLKALPLQVAVCPDDGWSNLASPHMRLLGGLPMAVVADRPIKQWDLLLKTALDKLGASILLVLLAPLLLGAAIAVGTTSEGPIIFRQKRQGWCGRDFTVLKFRTMRHETAGRFNLFQTRRNDARCTPVGRVLRRTSLDELPQLWNVLRGDMSLVGPRPHIESLHDIDRAGCEIVAEYAQRHRMKPGITGWAQVNGARGATATLDQMRRRVEYDLFYIEHWSIWLDLKILARTPFCMSGDNAF